MERAWERIIRGLFVIKIFSCSDFVISRGHDLKLENIGKIEKK